MFDLDRLARLVYVMGPSGAGKDSVLDYARRKLDGGHPVLFAHRYITRPPNQDIENYVALSPGEFALRQSRGLFAFDWEAYGWRYAIGIEIERWLAAGLTVVMDGSRAHFLAHADALKSALPVLVTADAETLRRRLAARGRENAAGIAQRMMRGEAFMPAPPHLVTIDNSGPLEPAGEALAKLLIERAEAGR